MQEPPPKKGPGKKKKGPKTNGVPEQPMSNHTNGDQMDIDHNGHTHGTNSVRADSDAMGSDVESPSIADIPISTLTIGQDIEIQTPADLTPNTIFACSVKDSDKTVTQTMWSPPDFSFLVAAGKSTLRLHIMGGNAENPSVFDIDSQLPLSNYFITAMCWNSPHDDITVSVQEERTNEVGEIMKSDKIFKVMEGGERYRVVSSTAGMVTTLRWNESRQLLLAMSSDGLKGSVKIWKDSEDDGEIQLPSWTTFTDTNIFDAAWTSNTSFVICGVGLFEIYEVGDSLSRQRTYETPITWESVKFDADSGIIAAMGMEGQTSYLGIIHPNNPTELQTQEYPDEYLMDLDFRPFTPAQSSGNLVMLATCSSSGAVRVWDANEPFRCWKQLQDVDQNPANKLAFSPNGAMLAVAGPDGVTVWGELERRDTPLATWRAADIDRREWDSTVDGEFSLGWDPDSSRLSIALGNQVRIIYCGPNFN